MSNTLRNFALAAGVIAIGGIAVEKNRIVESDNKNEAASSSTVLDIKSSVVASATNSLSNTSSSDSTLQPPAAENASYPIIPRISAATTQTAKESNAEFIERLGNNGIFTKVEADKTGAPLITTLDLPRGEPYITKNANTVSQSEWLDPLNGEDAPENIDLRPNYITDLFDTVEYFTAHSNDMNPALRLIATDSLIREAESYLAIDSDKDSNAASRGLDLAAQIYATVGMKNEAKLVLENAFKDGKFDGCEAYLDGIGCGIEQNVFNGDEYSYLTFVARGLALAGKSERANAAAESIRCLEGSHFSE